MYKRFALHNKIKPFLALSNHIKVRISLVNKQRKIPLLIQPMSAKMVSAQQCQHRNKSKVMQEANKKLGK